jgi:hypothetical protein
MVGAAIWSATSNAREQTKAQSKKMIGFVARNAMPKVTSGIVNAALAAGAAGYLVAAKSKATCVIRRM